MTLADVIHTVVEGFGYLGIFGGVCTWFLAGHVQKLSVEQKRNFALLHPRIFGFATTLIGAGFDRAKIKRGLLMLAKGTKSPAVVAIINALPDDEENEITLLPPPRAPASSLPETVRPPAFARLAAMPPLPPAPPAPSRVVIDGRHAGVEPDDDKPKETR